MIALKNHTENRQSFMFSGQSFTFSPGEIKLLEPAIADHLLRSSFTCATGGSTLSMIADNNIPSELLSSNTAPSPDVVLVCNASSKPISLMHDGRGFIVPAAGSIALPRHIAEAIYARNSSSYFEDLFLENVGKPEQPDTLSNNSSDASVEDEPKKNKKKKGYRK